MKILTTYLVSYNNNLRPRYMKNRKSFHFILRLQNPFWKAVSRLDLSVPVLMLEILAQLGEEIIPTLIS